MEKKNIRNEVKGGCMMLDIKEVHKTFNKGTINEKKALDDISLTVDTGDFITIIGSNGAGKSTLFNSISGEFFR